MSDTSVGSQTGNGSLKELALLFLRLGATSFGGPAAHIAMMEDEVVKRRRWLTPEQFMDMIAATNFIPGPNSTEMAIHVGYERAGMKGLVVAGVSFILPAFLIVLCLSWAYVRYGALPAASGFLYGVKPVVIAVVIQALWRLGGAAIKSRFLAILASIAAVSTFLGAGELPVLFACAAASVFVQPSLGRISKGFRNNCIPFISSFSIKSCAFFSTSAAVTAVVPLSQLFLIFLKIGSVLYGSGYVLLAFLRSDLVERFGWLTEAQLLDAVAIGQVTPGPVFTTATFVGYVTAGPSGAVVATVGIFLPAFFFVAIIAPLLPYLRRSPVATRALDGLNAASLALMAVVTLQLGSAAIVDWLTLSLVSISALLLLFWRTNSTWLVLGGGLVGVLST